MTDKKVIDPYLIPRIPITKNMDHAYLLEVGGLCPLCGKNMLAAKGNRKSKLYQIAHIYPNSPIPDQVKELDGLERLGVTCEDFENKIALCKDCHGLYDDGVSKEEYLALVDKKKKLMSVANSKVSISFQNLEEEITLILNSLNVITSDDLKEVSLKYKGLELKKKFEDCYAILRNKIESYNCTYYFFIKETFQNLERANKVHFNIIASEIKTSFLKCDKEMDDKSSIFNSLVLWMQSKIKGASIEACEVVMAFFVQNCEVFDEITE